MYSATEQLFILHILTYELEQLQMKFGVLLTSLRFFRCVVYFMRYGLIRKLLCLKKNLGIENGQTFELKHHILSRGAHMHEVYLTLISQL